MLSEIKTLKKVIINKNSEIDYLNNELKSLNEKYMRVTSFLTSPHNAIDQKSTFDSFPIAIDDNNKSHTLALKNACITSELEECKSYLFKEKAFNKVMKKLVSRIKITDKKRSISEMQNKTEKKLCEDKRLVTFKSITNEKMFTFLNDVSKCNSISDLIELCLKQMSHFIMYDYLNFIFIEDFIMQQAMAGKYYKKPIEGTKDKILIVSAVPDLYGEPYFKNINEIKSLCLRY
jgi:hypothetical protein